LTVIHIIRNPFDWIISAYNRPAKDKTGKVFAKYGVESNWPFKATDFSGEESRIDWKHASPIERLAWAWEFKNRRILDGMARMTRAHTVRFEDIFENERGHLVLSSLLQDLEVSSNLILKEYNPR